MDNNTIKKYVENCIDTVDKSILSVRIRIEDRCFDSKTRYPCTVGSGLETKFEQDTQPLGDTRVFLEDSCNEGEMIGNEKDGVDMNDLLGYMNELPPDIVQRGITRR